MRERDRESRPEGGGPSTTSLVRIFSFSLLFSPLSIPLCPLTLFLLFSSLSTSLILFSAQPLIITTLLSPSLSFGYRKSLILQHLSAREPLHNESAAREEIIVFSILLPSFPPPTQPCTERPSPLPYIIPHQHAVLSTTTTQPTIPTTTPAHLTTPRVCAPRVNVRVWICFRNRGSSGVGIDISQQHCVSTDDIATGEMQQVEDSHFF